MYEGIHHVSLSVTDLDRARTFYTDILEFKECRRPKLKSNGAWYQIGSTQLHLIEYEGKTLRRTTEIDKSDGHFAVRVTDMKEMTRKLREASIDYEEVPNSKTGWHQVYVTDRDGNIIEFNV
ncbi:VOC family protein [Alkalihalobacillus sp. 1P02AB]|uniref:VOC family protein n=1 Tax=Alkalihalobacillus sp. 1P02AB TaxID=3132260 RepID=UPI0039A75BE6